MATPPPAAPSRGPAGRRADDGARMPLAEHLRELRTRVIRAALGIATGTVAAYFLYDPIFKVLTHPFCSPPASRRSIDNGRIDASCHLYFFHPLDAFAIRV